MADTDPGMTFVAPPTPVSSGRRKRLGELLIDAGVISGEELREALVESPPGERLGQTLIRLGMADELEIAHALASQLGLEVIDLTGVTPHPLAVDRIPSRLAERHQLVPISLDDGVLTIAMADPADVVAVDDIRTVAGVRGIRRMSAAASDVDRTRRRAYRADATQDVIDEAEQPEEEQHETVDVQQPAVKLVTTLLTEAVAARAEAIGLRAVRLHADLAGRARVVAARQPPRAHPAAGDAA